ncbi:hypothetical protein [Chryseobacterium gwangjuense]|uniref:hypothetical protein n=1 Tax=Chryseobacterium gwangjuense TaxID=1069980 RepID=UPI001E48ABA0|nr:hypothetical protein [Chryseobacterium gwangjuense]MCE3074670.1 hypothetical protein [Chryseobacterium gwangjuense]
MNDSNSETIIKAVVYKIDSTKYSYIYYIKNKELKSGIFVKEKKCLLKTKSKRITVGKKYMFFLQKTIYTGNFNVDKDIINIDNEKQIVGDKTNIIFEDCLNVCGNYIDERKEVFKH